MKVVLAVSADAITRLAAVSGEDRLYVVGQVDADGKGLGATVYARLEDAEAHDTEPAPVFRREW